MFAMMKQVVSTFPLINLVLVGQLLFFTIFVGALAWVFRKGSKPYYDQLAQLPIEGSQSHE